MVQYKRVREGIKSTRGRHDDRGTELVGRAVAVSIAAKWLVFRATVDVKEMHLMFDPLTLASKFSFECSPQ